MLKRVISLIISDLPVSILQDDSVAAPISPSAFSFSETHCSDNLTTADNADPLDVNKSVSPSSGSDILETHSEAPQSLETCSQGQSPLLLGLLANEVLP